MADLSSDEHDGPILSKKEKKRESSSKVRRNRKKSGVSAAELADQARDLGDLGNSAARRILDDDDDPDAGVIAMAENWAAGAKRSCENPLVYLGVQEESPVAFNASGSHLAFAAKNGSVFIAVLGVDTKTFTIERTLNGHRLPVRALVFHPDEQVLISAGGDGVFVWDVQKGSILSHIKVVHDSPKLHEGEIVCLALLHDATLLVTGSKDTTVKVWDLELLRSGKGMRPIETLTAHKAPVMCFAVCSERHMLASAGRDSSIKLWDISTLDEAWREKRRDDASIQCNVTSSLDAHRGDVVSLCFAAGGARLFSGARDNEIKMWDVDAATELRAIKGHRGDVRAMVLLQNEDRMLTGCNDSFVRFWKLADYKPTKDEAALAAASASAMVADLAADMAAAAALMDNPDSGISVVGEGEEFSAAAAAAAVAGGLAIGNAAGDRVMAQHACHDFDVMFMDFHHRRQLMATSSSENEVRLWSMRDPEHPVMIHEFVGHSEKITSVAMASDNIVLSSSLDYKVAIYELEHQSRVASFDCGGSVEDISMTADCKGVLCAGNQYDIKMFNVDATAARGVRYAEVARFVGHSGKVETVAVAPDGSLMASGGHDFNIILWPMKDKYVGGSSDGKGLDEGENDVIPPITVKPLATVDAHRGHVTSIAFSDSADFLVSGGTDHGVILWKVKRGGRLSSGGLTEMWHDSTAHISVVTSVAFGHGLTKDLIISGSWDATVCVWDVKGRGVNQGKAAPNGHDSTCGGPVKQLKLHQSKVTSVTFEPTGDRFITASADSTVRLWASGSFECECVYAIPNSEGSITSVSCAADSFAAGAENGMLRIFPLPVQKYQNHFKST